jgi:hypothetical protein
LGGFLVSWAGVTPPDLNSNTALDLQQLVANSGRMLFLINWESQAAAFELTVPLERPARQVREVTTGAAAGGGSSRIAIRGEVPALGVRVYRVDY